MSTTIPPTLPPYEISVGSEWDSCDTDDYVSVHERSPSQRWTCIDRAQPREARKLRRRCGKYGRTQHTVDRGEPRQRHLVMGCCRHDCPWCTRSLTAKTVSHRLELLPLATAATGRPIRTDALWIEDPRLAPPPSGCDAAEARGGRLCLRAEHCSLCEGVRPAHDTCRDAEEEDRHAALAILAYRGIVGSWGVRPVTGRSAMVIYVTYLDCTGVLTSRRRRDAAGKLQSAAPARLISVPPRNDSATATTWTSYCSTRGARGGYATWTDHTPEAVARRLWSVHAPLAGDVERMARAGRLTDNQIRDEIRRVTLGRETRSTGSTTRRPWQTVRRAGWLGGLANSSDATLAALQLSVIPEPPPRTWRDLSVWGCVERLLDRRRRVRDVHDRQERVIQLRGDEPLADSQGHIVAFLPRPRVGWSGQAVQIPACTASASPTTPPQPPAAPPPPAFPPCSPSTSGGAP